MIVYEFEDGFKAIIGFDIADNAHPIGNEYPNSTDHLNIEIQNASGVTKFNLHIIIDEFMNAIDSIITGPWGGK